MGTVNVLAKTIWILAAFAWMDGMGRIAVRTAPSIATIRPVLPSLLAQSNLVHRAHPSANGIAVDTASAPEKTIWILAAFATKVGLGLIAVRMRRVHRARTARRLYKT